MAFSIHTIYGEVFKIWRRRRFDFFVARLKPTRSTSLLDVGGYPGFWAAQRPLFGKIVTLNVDTAPWNKDSAPEHDIVAMSGDGCALPMPDKSYDIGYSNSVIEHVGSLERQERFAAEIRRVGKALWVQTPAYECPIEPHYLTPFVHYLPRSIQKRIIRWLTIRGWIERPTPSQIEAMVDTTRLMRKPEMSRLFPDCEIITERLLWIIPKSYIAVRNGATVSQD